MSDRVLVPIVQEPEVKPTVGRIVHWTPSDSDQTYIACRMGERVAPSTREPTACIVTSTTPTLRLRALLKAGADVDLLGVPYAEAPTPGHWSWPKRV